MRQIRKRIAIIGGGAAGLMAAISAAEHGGQVTIFERNDKIGKKILATGNGKCNFSNENLSKDHYAGSVLAFFDSIYGDFNRESLKSFFIENGILIKDKKGYLYPNTEQAATVVDLFLEKTKNLGIRMQMNCCVQPKQVCKTANGFRIITKEYGKQEFDALILATGGVASPKTGSDGIGFDIAKSFGHHLVPVVPSLVQLYTTDENAKALAGVRTDALIKLYVDKSMIREEYGELQLTDYGVSGIPVFQLSRYAGYGLRDKKNVHIQIDFLRDYQEEELVSILENKWNIIKATNSLSITTKEAFFHGLINKKITMVILKKCGMKPTDHIENLRIKDMVSFVRQCKCYETTISKTNSFDHAQVTAGGIPVKEINEDLSSKLVEGLFFAGEILDIDGICGGYNLQWAFSSGYCVGVHASSIL